MSRIAVIAVLVGMRMAFATTVHAANFAESVVSYVPGTGFATEFGTGLGFTNTAAVLGVPSRVTPGQFGGWGDPFNPPYLRDQLVSIGTGGSLTVKFSSPVLNNASNPFGIDFIVYGNAGFVITNGDFSGAGITDGTTFGANSGATRVSVSSDNVTYYTLNPSLTPTVDGPFPTDGQADFFLPLNPALKASQFAGKGLTGIRALYVGAAGGAGFDIGWAQNSAGGAANLASIQYVRVDVLGGVSDIDGFVAVPEPAVMTLFLATLAVVGLTGTWRTSGKRAALASIQSRGQSPGWRQERASV